MTVIVAARCRDGAVIASDSQATEMVAGVRWEVQKLFPLTGTSVWGASGMTTLIDDVREELERNSDLIERSADFRNTMRSLIRPIMERHYSAYLPGQGGQGYHPQTDFTACGLDLAGEPFILELDRNANCGWVTRDWHALGSGAGFAQMAGALLEHFGLRGRSVDDGKVIVFRALDAVIQTSNFGVGGQPQMWVITRDGCHCLDGAEVETLRNIVAGWKEIELDSLDTAMGRPPVVEEPVPAPVAQQPDQGPGREAAT
jgi:20S proteasome alpha/beta subunit